jgi:uncharacterized protein with von Willebrand factor type A (vWA) domain
VTDEGSGRFAENVMHFARVLRGAGLKVGPDRVVDALQAAEITGIARRDDFYWTLASVFVDRHDQLAVFEQAFRLFWRDPQFMERMMQTLLPRVEGRVAGNPSVGNRVGEAFRPPAPPRTQAPERPVEFDAALSISEREVLQHKDFDTMSNAELAAAQRMIAGMRLPLREITTRRFEPRPLGGIDARASLRAGMRAGGDMLPLKRRAHKRRIPPLVVLCDISGSMSRYTRLFLLFVHAAANHLRDVHVLTFGTRLTNVTRQLRHRDADAALAGIGSTVNDWSGGTRIGECLHAFNRLWSRRLLAQGAGVLLLTDGLERGDAVQLAQEAERLHKSCRGLIWLNPLLRYAGFEARAAGVRALLPHVDRFLPVHNLASLAQIGGALANVTRGGIASRLPRH